MPKVKLSKEDLSLIKDFVKTMPIYEKRHTSGKYKGEFIMEKLPDGRVVYKKTDPFQYMVNIIKFKGVDALPKYYRAYLDEYQEVKKLLIENTFNKVNKAHGAKPTDIPNGHETKPQ